MGGSIKTIVASESLQLVLERSLKLYTIVSSVINEAEHPYYPAQRSSVFPSCTQRIRILAWDSLEIQIGLTIRDLFVPNVVCRQSGHRDSLMPATFQNNVPSPSMRIGLDFVSGRYLAANSRPDFHVPASSICAMLSLTPCAKSRDDIVA